MSVATALTSTTDACTSTDSPVPEQLHPISTLTKRGYGSRATIKDRIKHGEIPAVRVGNIIKIRDRDVALLAVPVVPTGAHGGDAA